MIKFVGFPREENHFKLNLFFFFFLISNFKFINKAQIGATLIHRKYTRAPLKRRNR